MIGWQEQCEGQQEADNGFASSVTDLFQSFYA